MVPKVCSIEDCDSSYRMRRGWCNKHYLRWMRHGDPLQVTHYLDPEDAFASRTKRSDSGCLEWTGSKDTGGYGSIRISDRLVRVHRYAWERTNGPIPAGMMVDHICWVRHCCEVGHLRLVTNKQNCENRSGPQLNGTSGFRGVTFHKVKKKWLAYVKHSGKFYNAGYFDSPEAASEAASSKRAELFTHSQN